jgi:hypothetical protein
LPLLLVDFRNRLHIRRHEMTQRAINEITAGVIGISHFTNWYYYVAADLYDFVTARHGAAMNQASRLDCYSRFRVDLALDHQGNPELRKQMQQHVDALAQNPLEAAPDREFEIAQMRYQQLVASAQDDRAAVVQRIDNDRRSELASFAESRAASFRFNLLHDLTFGRYTHRAKKDPDNRAVLDRYRRIESQLNFLDNLAAEGTQPEVAYDATHIRSSLIELRDLLPTVRSAPLRRHAEATLIRVKELSRDAGVQTDCSQALLVLKEDAKPAAAAIASLSVDVPSTIASAESDVASH